jgi:hypothetical protein
MSGIEITFQKSTYAILFKSQTEKDDWLTDLTNNKTQLLTKAKFNSQILSKAKTFLAAASANVAQLRASKSLSRQSTSERRSSF